MLSAGWISMAAIYTCTWMGTWGWDVMGTWGWDGDMDLILYLYMDGDMGTGCDGDMGMGWGQVRWIVGWGTWIG